jgi:hypothetical protein
MDTGTKSYKIDQHKQLIPLNGSTVNFSCFFEVKSKDKKQFNVAVVEQSEMKPKQYKLVEDGYINGQIESDGQLKSYFLVLKSQQPCECDVRVVVKPKESQNNTKISDDGNDPPLSTEPNHPQPNQPTMTNPPLVIQKPENYFQLKYILGISVILILLYVLYKYRKTISSKLFPKENFISSMSPSSF